MKCLKNSENYNMDEEKITECFVLSEHLKSLDNISDLLDKMLETLDRCDKDKI